MYNQFGSRKNISTIFALLQITEKSREIIDKSKFGCGIFIDLTLSITKYYLQKPEYYGIRGSALNWFESYLENRKQYVY